MISVNPYDESISTFNTMDTNVVLNIIDQTHHIWRTTWASSPLDYRISRVIQVKQLLLEQQQYYATLIVNEMGKPINQALQEISKCATLCEHYINNIATYLAKEKISNQDVSGYRCFQPTGIILGIMPWNFPFWQVMRFAIPNLLAGNAILLKHAPNTTGVSLAIEQIFIRADINVFRSLVIDTSIIPCIINHQHISGVTLTGSRQAGKAVASAAGAALKKTVLELGGNDPCIILDDANLEHAALECVHSRLNNAGQVCIAAKRIIVTKKNKRKLEQLILDAAKKYICGNPMSPETTLGPLARKDLLQTLHQQVSTCIQESAHCVLGGQFQQQTGFYYPATVLFDVKHDSIACREEIFGPVICVLVADDVDDAINIANDTEFGLGAAIFTQNISLAKHIAIEQLQAGICAINRAVTSYPMLPFGGIKCSGYGRELAAEGVYEFMNIKTILLPDGTDSI